LYHDLDVQTIEQLRRAAKDGRIRSIPGFGEKTELNIPRAVEVHANQSRCIKLAVAAQYVESICVFEADSRGAAGCSSRQLPAHA